MNCCPEVHCQILVTTGMAITAEMSVGKRRCLGHDLDLVVTLDDATGADLFGAPGRTRRHDVELSLVWRISEHGLFGALYTRSRRALFRDAPRGRKVDGTQLTQVDRALSPLGITHIPSYSPQARGRMERVFGTLQNRLPQELRLAGIKTVAAGNRYLKERFVPDYNARLAVPAAEPGSAFVPYLGRPIRRGPLRGVFLKAQLLPRLS
jgi:hypothetical protein